MHASFINDLDTLGYFLVEGAIEPSTVADWSESLDESLNARQSGTLTSQDKVYGSRNLLGVWSDIREVHQHAVVRSFAQEILGRHAGLVRVLFFDKPPGRSWSLPWHRDMTIAVQQHQSDLGEFRCPTVKSGQPHVEAPTWLLQQMVTLRIHLDPMTESNGPLVVMPGSHQDGKCPIGHRNEGHQGSGIETILCGAGSIFAMRPLLAHSSRQSSPETESRRRILHLEYSATAELPCGFQWQHFVA